MGRIAGVTATETRDRLLRAAAKVFAERGYDGARVADIAVAAGVSNGAMYAHFGSKADLLVGALRMHGRQVLADALAADPDKSITEVLVGIGRGLIQRDTNGSLLVEALVAARRDENVARLMRDYIGERSDWMADLMRVAQARNELDAALSPDALAHFCLLLAMGSALVTPDLRTVDGQQWATLLGRVVGGLGLGGSGSPGTDVTEGGRAQ
jgi:AcrR family transcriptional regulator